MELTIMRLHRDASRHWSIVIGFHQHLIVVDIIVMVREKFLFHAVDIHIADIITSITTIMDTEGIMVVIIAPSGLDILMITSV